MANSCLTLEDDVQRSPLHLLEASDESSKLLFASDDLLGRDGHERIVPQLPRELQIRAASRAAAHVA